jgi:hypothetical protein
VFDSFIKACQAFFTQEPHGRKVTIEEFKNLTTDDRLDLSKMLNMLPGFEHPPYVPVKKEG